jgi:peptidoglycan/xylan/chitin deacetylase (PgdA/CDA1 family)
VHPQRDPLWDPIDPAHFRRIISYLSKEYTLFLLEDLIYQKDILNQTYKKPLAAVVFDDGYKDFMNYALPVLEEFKTPASMYIITDAADSGRPPWTYMLDYAFVKTNKLDLKWNNDLLPAELSEMNWNSAAERLDYGRKIKPFLKKIPHSQRAGLMDQLLTWFNDVEMPADLFMNWDEIRQVANAGYEIGSHTVSHPLLATIEDNNLLREELSFSREILHKQLGKYPVAISYPNGSFNSQVKKISAEVGYQLGLATNQHAYKTEKYDLFEIPRIELYNETMFMTKLRIWEVVTNIKDFLGK